MAKSKPEVARCRSCNAEIYWVRGQATGALCPIDITPVENGNVLLQKLESGELVAVYLKKGDLFSQTADGTRHTSHFTTCPEADKWRRKKTS